MKSLTHVGLTGLVVAACAFSGRQARGQGAATLADEIIIISSGQRAKERGRDGSTLGPVHGAAERPFARIAGADESRLGTGTPASRPIDVLSAAARPDLIFDYFGFPEHTYRLRFATPGSPDRAR